MYNLTFNRKNYVFSAPINFTIPKFTKSNYQVFTEDFQEKTYFYLNAKAPLLNRKAKSPPKNITIYWDRSHSAIKRDLTKELALVNEYLITLPGVKHVSLIGFNYRESNPVQFSIGEDASRLINYIRSLSNDGATRIDNINFDKNADEVLLFTDAINTIGRAKFIEFTKVPVFAIYSSLGSNYNILKQTAAMSGGVCINLARGIDDAITLLTYHQEKVVSVGFDEVSIEDLYYSMSNQNEGYIEVVGVLRNAKTKIDVNYGFGLQKSQSQSFEIIKSNSASVARVWASKKIESLESNYNQNQQEILKLGQQFTIVTRNSALLVLDRIEDYVTHEIVPPAPLREEYDRLINLKRKEVEIPTETIFNQTLGSFHRLREWYDNIQKPNINESKSSINSGADLEVVELDDEITEEVVIESIVFSEAPEEEELEVMDYISEDVVSQKEKATPSRNASIKVLAWLPDAPYMMELRALEDEELDTCYFLLKQENLARPSFYIQVAGLYFQRGLDDMAVQVLSNIIELDLENPELLKVVGRTLLNENEFELAISIYREIKELRPEEPQSYRDLAIAYEASGQFQEALETYQYLLNHSWDRFEEIKAVIFNEFNALISKHKLDLTTINKSLVKAMPLDIRVVIDWSSNDNDIDLWVVDPNGEKCFYSHPNTAIGGKISKDFTRGYGPEEFTVKNAKRGFYTVYVNYFSESRQTITGPVTVYATLYTHYGTKDQIDKKIALQLVNGKQTEQIGQLEFIE